MMCHISMQTIDTRNGFGSNTALYSFRNYIRTLQAAHHKAATQEPEEAGDR